MKTKMQRWIFIGVVVSMTLGIAAYKFWWELKDSLGVESSLSIAPDYELIAANGTITSSQDLKGRPYLLTFFSSWCFSCRLEHKTLGSVAKGHNLPLVGIAYRDSHEAIFNWLSRFGNPFTRIGFDETGELGNLWGITGVPETFLIDKDGVVRAHVQGALFSDENIAYLEKAIKNL